MRTPTAKVNATHRQPKKARYTRHPARPTPTNTGQDEQDKNRRRWLTRRDKWCIVPLVKINRHSLRAIRELSGMSKADLGRATDIDRTLIGRMESGERPASPAQIRLMAKALGVQPLALTLYVTADELEVEVAA